jgi:hypothetical protein
MGKQTKPECGNLKAIEFAWFVRFAVHIGWWVLADGHCLRQSHRAHGRGRRRPAHKDARPTGFSNHAIAVRPARLTFLPPMLILN